MNQEGRLLLCQRFAEALAHKGALAFFGAAWDGACDYKESTFWYFHPQGESNVGVYVEYSADSVNETRAYDPSFIGFATCEAALARIEQLDSPTRNEIWEALEPSFIF